MLDHSKKWIPHRTTMSLYFWRYLEGPFEWWEKVTTIVFDIGGVLLDIHPERTYQYISDSTDINIDIVKNIFPWHAHA